MNHALSPSKVIWNLLLTGNRKFTFVWNLWRWAQTIIMNGLLSFKGITVIFQEAGSVRWLWGFVWATSNVMWLMFEFRGGEQKKKEIQSSCWNLLFYITWACKNTHIKLNLVSLFECSNQIKAAYLEGLRAGFLETSPDWLSSIFPKLMYLLKWNDDLGLKLAWHLRTLHQDEICEKEAWQF